MDLCKKMNLVTMSFKTSSIKNISNLTSQRKRMFLKFARLIQKSKKKKLLDLKLTKTSLGHLKLCKKKFQVQFRLTATKKRMLLTKLQRGLSIKASILEGCLMSSVMLLQHYFTYQIKAKEEGFSVKVK